MGNKLCGAERDAAGLHQFHGGGGGAGGGGNGGGGGGGRPRLGEPGWHPKKDTHLLRLWAEVFRVRDNEFGWERVSDDVVPINITCLEDGSSRVFQITAYSRNALKLFDARIIHPGERV
ncbi:hypothetical protein BOX15_Mlig023088g1 [Macrostomum lignano]|uniref:Uncharacterized protein n=1 Tax=Macrostomum lignano TaxID=282301 RepID=A0A267EZT0_9PLAT|nr:hypothetical protein BOX15_Mlig023088g1 [Macrostomum lignano]